MLNNLLGAVRARTSRRSARRALAALAIAAVAATAACGDGGATAGGKCEVQVGTKTGSKPEITVPNCAAKPHALVTRDIVEGTGEPAKPGDTVNVQYVGISWSTKKQFDASWDNGAQPFAVTPLGQASVIPGWNVGLIGAKAGGRRLLVIPPDLGYGPQGSGEIRPNETLIFVVDVLSVN